MLYIFVDILKNEMLCRTAFSYYAPAP